MARLHKRAFYWAHQSGSPWLGPLPRKHSSEGVSPYPCALAERSQYYHCTALSLSPPLSFPPPPPHVLSPSAISALFSICISTVLLFSSFSSSPPPAVLCYALHTFQPNRLPSGGCDLRRNVISSPATGCASLKSVLTVSYYIVYLPEGGGSCALTTFKSARSRATTSPCLASLSCCDMWFIMSTVIPVRIGLRMRSRWRKLSLMLRCLRQEINSLALKYHKLLHSNSISG